MLSRLKLSDPLLCPSVDVVGLLTEQDLDLGPHFQIPGVDLAGQLHPPVRLGVCEAPRRLVAPYPGEETGQGLDPGHMSRQPVYSLKIPESASHASNLDSRASRRSSNSATSRVAIIALTMAAMLCPVAGGRAPAWT